MSLPVLFLIDFKVSEITDKVLRPRASSLIRPISATVSISYATTGILPETSSFASALDSIGAYFLKSSFATTTPAACTPTLRIFPRSLSASQVTSGYFVLNSFVFDESIKSSNVSIDFIARLTSDSGTINTRAASLITPLSLK